METLLSSHPAPPSPFQIWLDTDDSWRPRCSYFRPPISNTLPETSLRLVDIHRKITGEDFQKITAYLRGLEDPKARRTYKAKAFPYVTFAGIFKKRCDQDLLHASELMVLDFDDVKDVALARQRFLSDPLLDPELLFVSPSGKGLKLVIRIPDEDLSYTDNFIGIAEYIREWHRLEADPSGKDLSRACFLTNDPEAFLHKRHKEIV